MAGRNFLFVPGPTNVPDRILRAMVVPMEDHRSSSFPELTRACLTGLKSIFKTTTAAPILFPSSGTGCWEAALTNCLNPGDKVLAAIRSLRVPSGGGMLEDAPLVQRQTLEWKTRFQDTLRLVDEWPREVLGL